MRRHAARLLAAAAGLVPAALAPPAVAAAQTLSTPELRDIAFAMDWGCFGPALNADAPAASKAAEPASACEALHRHGRPSMIVRNADRSHVLWIYERAGSAPVGFALAREGEEWRITEAGDVRRRSF